MSLKLAFRGKLHLSLFKFSKCKQQVKAMFKELKARSNLIIKFMF